MNTIGANIKQLRKIHNLNQTDFANKIGVSQSDLSDLESGKGKPAIETVSQFALSSVVLMNGF